MRSSNNNDLDQLYADDEAQEIGMTYDEEVVKIGSRNPQPHALQYVSGGTYGDTITEDQRSSVVSDS